MFNTTVIIKDVCGTVNDLSWTICIQTLWCTHFPPNDNLTCKYKEFKKEKKNKKT